MSGDTVLGILAVTVIAVGAAVIVCVGLAVTLAVEEVVATLRPAPRQNVWPAVEVRA